LGTVAQNLIDLIHFQVIENPLKYAMEILDKNNTGELSIQTIAEDDLLKNILLTNPSSENNDTESVTQDLLKLFNNQGNARDRISIQNQLKPILIESFNNETNSINTECMGKIYSIWIKSHSNLSPTLDIIGNVSSSINILILNGENDSQTTIQQALLLNQKLDEKGHVNELITYPNLGHLFYPSSIWLTGLGPIELNVLGDLYA